MARTTVFVSYSHEDRRFLDQLLKHLAPFALRLHLEVWDDTKIAVGARWRDEIVTSIRNSRMCIALISPDFLASKFITEVELPEMLRGNSNDGLIPCLIHVRASVAGVVRGLGEFQALNSPEQPIASLRGHRRDLTWQKIVEVIASRLQAVPHDGENAAARDALNRSNRVLVRYVIALDNLRQAFQYVGELAFESDDDFQELSDAVVAYNTAIEELQQQKAELGHAIAQWSDDGGDALRSLFDHIDLELHAGHVLALNETRVRIHRLQRGQVPSDQAANFREGTLDLLNVQLRALGAKIPALRARVSALYERLSARM